VPIRASTTTELGRSVVAISGLPDRRVAWRQFRALGSAALALCDVAAGHVDAYLDAHAGQHAPWDYLGGLLVCREAGALVVDMQGDELALADPSVRRQLIAAGTPELLAALTEAAT
jgi:myo-inositol-1(or 4)-monophosphatase